MLYAFFTRLNIFGLLRYLEKKDLITSPVKRKIGNAGKY